MLINHISRYYNDLYEETRVLDKGSDMAKNIVIPLQILTLINDVPMSILFNRVDHFKMSCLRRRLYWPMSQIQTKTVKSLGNNLQ